MHWLVALLVGKCQWSLLATICHLLRVCACMRVKEMTWARPLKTCALDKLPNAGAGARHTKEKDGGAEMYVGVIWRTVPRVDTKQIWGWVRDSQPAKVEIARMYMRGDHIWEWMGWLQSSQMLIFIAWPQHNTVCQFYGISNTRW